MNEIYLEHYLILSSIIFVIGVSGLYINRRNIIHLLISIELMMLAVSINFVAFSSYANELTGQIFSLFILAIAAAKTSVGLAILMVYFRNVKTIEIDATTQSNLQV